MLYTCTVKKLLVTCVRPYNLTYGCFQFQIVCGKVYEAYVHNIYWILNTERMVHKEDLLACYF